MCWCVFSRIYIKVFWSCFISLLSSPVTMRGTGLQRLRAGARLQVHCSIVPSGHWDLRTAPAAAQQLATSEAGTGSVSAAAGVAPRPVTLSLATANIPQTLAALFQIDRILQPQKYLLLPRKYLLLLRALPCKFVSGPEWECEQWVGTLWAEGFMWLFFGQPKTIFKIEF